MYPITVMCRVLKLSTSGYYKWRNSPAQSESARSDADLLKRIPAIHADARGTYGSPRIHAKLRRLDVWVSRKRVARLMRQDGLAGKVRRRFVVTTDSAHSLPVAPKILDRDFWPEKVDQAWVGDITYIWTQTGWAYLAVIIDLKSRLVVGWELADHMRTELIDAALTNALGARVPRKGMIHHSDRGSQYASTDFRRRLETLSIQVSMSRRGNCWDNAVAESFFGTLKQELVHESRWASVEAARPALHDYIEVFYNRKRLHSSHGYRTPAETDQEDSAACSRRELLNNS